MSQYRNYIRNFPERCIEMLGLIKNPQVRQRRDVTLLLMVASTALVIPFERLRPVGKYKQPMNDRDRFQDATKRLDEFLKVSFIKSRLLSSDAELRYGNVASVDEAPDQWKELENPGRISEAEDVEKVLTILRHALAHGNLYTLSRDGSIADVVFVCGGMTRKSGISPYQFLILAPQQLRELLQNWARFLATLDIPESVIASQFDEAA